MGYRMLGMPWGILGGGLGNKLGGANAPSGGGPPPFFPSDVAGLVVEIDPDTGMYQEHNSKTTPSGNGDLVGTAEDQSGSGHDMTAKASDATRPTLITNNLNTHSILRYTGGQSLRTVFALNNGCTIYFVVKQTGWTSLKRLTDGGAAVTTLIQFNASPDVGLNAGALLGPFSDLTINNWFIVRVVINGASSSIRANGGAALTGNAGALNPGGFTMGSAFGQAGDFSNIDVGYALVYSAVISGDDDTNIMNFLNSRFAIY